MAENFEVIYTHPSGATATFVRQNGQLDSLAKGLDAEQFWTFKQVKTLLVRNDTSDLAESNRLMEALGFTALVREITPMAPAPSMADLRDEALAGTSTGEHEAAHGHAPQPSFWPLFLAMFIGVTLIGLMFMESTIAISAVGLIGIVFCMYMWGTEAFHIEL
jgi:hypothetical protein